MYIRLSSEMIDLARSEFWLPPEVADLCDAVDNQAHIVGVDFSRKP